MRSIFPLFILIFFYSCNSNKTTAIAERDTIYCDESYKNIIAQEAEVFEFQSNKDTLNIVFSDEATILKKLLDGSCKAAIIGKKLTDAERKKIKETDTVVPFENVLAKESIALIVAKDFSAQSINIVDLKNYLTSPNPPYTLLFDKNDNGTLKYCLKQLNIDKPSAKLYAQSSVDSLVNYVAQNPKTIGFISYAIISDEYSAETTSILNRVAVLPITFTDSLGKKWTADAMQSSIATGEYPLIRPINFVNCNSKDISVRRFLNFLFDTKAARIFQKAGLIPAKPAERQIIVNTESLKKD